jgi:superfamily II DNA helicase RecQ
MPYMICKKCDIYYELADENAEKDLKICQCGSRMKYYEKLEDYLNSMEYSISGKPLNIMDRLTMDYESAISRIILQCLSEIPIDLGVKRFMLVLKGNKSPFILKYELDKLKTYAMLSSFSEEHLRIIIDSITDNGFIKSEYISQYDGSNLKITEKGRIFLNMENNSQIGFMKKII